MLHHRCKGVSLVEVALALMLLAVGVLGAGAVQLSAQRTQQHAQHLQDASLLASSIAARVSLNRPAMGQYMSFTYDASVDGDPAPAPSCFGPASCDAAALAAFDRYEFALAAQRLPGGRIVLCQDAAPWDAAAQRWRWSCTAPAGTSPPLVIKIGWQLAPETPLLVRLAP